jgi:uncharacterized protein (TIGR00661 family)
MKVLYAIQGTGNGHVSRAREVIPVLKQLAEVDVFLSGRNSNIKLPFDIDYSSKGLSFEYGTKGGLDYWQTIRKVSPLNLMKEIRDFPIQKYDLVINDFECISAYAAQLKKVPCISFSHQASLLSDKCPKPEKTNKLGEYILKHYAPTHYAVGMHFKRYDGSIFTPIIRKEIRQLNPIQLGHYTVYLPAVGTLQLTQLLSQIPDVRWEVFSRDIRYTRIEKNITIRPIQNDVFIQSLATCKGLLTGAGFESPAEAMYLNKKVFVIPIEGQYEQLCNARSLQDFGIESASFQDINLLKMLQKWVNQSSNIDVNYPDLTQEILEKILFNQSSFKINSQTAG